ncbi:universal stress protein [Anderseniella sp. Alg231-50]|uniref:universal stress protein n=1 Tax=Anderseniella sp. Alg231-50 TaxID=1922226 RepID=UPI00307B74F0
MNPKTFVVSLNDTDNLDHLLTTCSLFAARNGAHVIGAYIIPSVEVFAVYGGIAMADVVDAQRKRYQSMAKQVREKFERVMALNSLSCEWRELDAMSSSIGREFVDQCRFADLAVIAQVDAGENCGVEPSFAEYVVMEAGRPVLLVPRGKPFEIIGSRALMGWNGAKEAARACFDALPLLPADSEVSIVWVDPQRQRSLAGNVPGAELAATFARHDIRVTAEPMPTADTDAGRALLARVEDVGADLLVMGAYGHSRVREFVFGGATEHVLNNMTVPVLMSH